MREEEDDLEEEEREASPLTVPRMVMAVATMIACGFIVNNAIYGQPERPAAKKGTVTVQEESVAPRAKPATQPQLATRARVEAPPPDDDISADTDLRELQASLLALGHYRGPVDGAMSDATHEAIRSAERDLGFEETGEPSPALAERLRLQREFAAIADQTASPAPAPDPSPAKSLEATPDVGAVQRALAQLGYSPGPADGTLGPKTREAIRLFERDRRLKETGNLSPELLKEAARL
ncbi:MAG: peptidoglycan-binding protein [Parvibaculaceae bacterium]